MDRSLLAASLGAIASYSASRDVPAARVVFCDAEAYDQGYMAPADIAGTVKVKGRGGTVLQPGIEVLVRAEDFPEAAPILIITDGYCDNRLVLHGREHAFLIPYGAHLPFVAKGPVFRMR
jgi:predicted metal-dependent peptidase